MATDINKENPEVNPNPETPKPEPVATGDAELKELLSNPKYGVSNPDTTIQALQDLGIDTVDDLKMMDANELVDAGIKLAKARKLLEDVKGATPETPAPNPAPMAGAGQMMMPMVNVVSLPDIPNDEAWLADLKTDGILKCNKTAYISAVRASIADGLDVHGLPKKLCNLIKEFAVSNDEPVPELYFEILKLANRRKYADIFSAIGGESGITEADRKALMERMRTLVWPAAGRCFYQLKTWMDTWTATAGPQAIMSVLGNLCGGSMGMMPTANAIPDVSAIRDSGDDLRNNINRALSGVGPATAASIACDYAKVKEILNKPELPAAIGVAGREQLFKKLGINVGSGLIRTEENLVQFILGMALIDQYASADSEVPYFNALYRVGLLINWSDLGVTNTGLDIARNGSFESITGSPIRNDRL